jgi:hypothetical protein
LHTFAVSKNEIERMSPEAEYWVKGFLCGNEPDTPLDRDGYDLEETHPEVKRWRQAIELFAESGVWVDQRRYCQQCGAELLPSQLGLLCQTCAKEGAA